MEILPILLLAVLEISHSDNLIVVNDPHVSIRHARKKEQASREDHVLKIIDNQDELSAFTWSTESPMVEELTTDKTIEDDETLFYDSKNVLEENFNYSVKEDVVTKFLRIVESQNELGENCTAGTDLNLGEGVVDRYAQERFRVEAEVAVNRANMLTRLWKYMDHEVMMKSEYLLHANVLSMVEFNENIFAGGNCYDEYQYKPYLLFCPYAYRLPEGGILVKNLAVEYKYLGNNSEWFFQARKNAEKVINKKKTYRYGYHTYTLNATSHTERIPDKVLSVRYEDGRWSKPYYDCGGGNIWMLTYTVPFFGYDKAAGDYFFKGTSGIDIDLRRVDIDQCPTPKGEKKLNIFAASDKCKKETTYCVPIEGFGFRRGSYKCVCRKGFYFSNHTANHPYFDGAVIEEEYEKLMLNERSIYNKSNTFQCLPCAEGCENCTNSKPCILALNWVLRSVILGLSFLIMFILIIVGTLTWRYQDIKVVRAASPALLRVIAVGAFFIYLTTVVMYPSPTIVTCTAKIWFREIGFSLTYGALMLKTWRISRIFHIKSARKVRITDMDLLKKLGLIVLIFISFLSIRTLVDPPLVLTVRTADDLQAYLCESNMWDHWFTMMEVVFLMWGIRLCIMVRKAPSEFNESRWISLAIYNEFILSIFLNVSMFFVHSPANPDLLYVICFGHTQMTVTVLLCFIFGSKAYMIHTGNGKDNNNSTGRLGPKMQILSKKTLPTSSQAFPSTTSIEVTDVKMTEEDVREEIHHTCQQLELLKERSAQLGSEKLATRLKAAHEYVTRTMGDLSTDEQRSSAERSTDDPYPLNRSTVQRVPNTANNCKKTRHDNCAVLSIEADRSKNACSTNSAKSSGSCGLKKYIFRKTNFFSSNHGNNSDLGSGAVDVPMEPLQVHDVFTVEEKSKDSQVSL